MYWLIIGEGEEKYALNVGKKSYEEVNKLIAKDAEKEMERGIEKEIKSPKK